jgi:FtsH-binding integral membrane protein
LIFGSSLVFIGLILVELGLVFFISARINSYIGVIVLAALTAYDTQRLKTMARSQPGGLDVGVIRKGAILGALSLYLNFVNLFIMLLSIMGLSRA